MKLPYSYNRHETTKELMLAPGPGWLMPNRRTMVIWIRGGTARKGGGRWANLEVREAGDGWENGPK